MTKKIAVNPKSSQYVNEDGSRTRFMPRPNSKIDSVLEKKKDAYRKTNAYVKDIDNSQVRVHRVTKQTNSSVAPSKKDSINKYKGGVTLKEYEKMKSKKGK